MSIRINSLAINQEHGKIVHVKRFVYAILLQIQIPGQGWLFQGQVFKVEVTGQKEVEVKGQKVKVI